jgi:hypothetical protein
LPNYVIGLDIGQHVDHSALAIVERLIRVSNTGGPPDEPVYADVYRIVHLRQWPLGTTALAVIDDISELVGRAQGRLDWAVIAYDATGIGASWTDLIYRRHRARDLTRFWPRPYIITGEQTPSKDPSVRKIDLMSKIQVTANEGRLELDPDLPLADRLAVQLQAITATPTATGRLSFGAPQAVHDDLVIGLGLALYSRIPDGQVRPRNYIIGQPVPAIDPLGRS